MATDAQASQLDDANSMSEILKILKCELGANAVVGGSAIGDKYAVDVSGENPRKPAAGMRPRTTTDQKMSSSGENTTGKKQARMRPLR